MQSITLYALHLQSLICTILPWLNNDSVFVEDHILSVANLGWTCATFDQNLCDIIAVKRNVVDRSVEVVLVASDAAVDLWS